MSQRAVFLDKDGTLIQNVPYNVDPDLVSLTTGAPAALRQLQAAGYLIVVVSNQSGVARGYFAEGALQAVDARLQELLCRAGVALNGFYWCPHHPDGSVSGYARTCHCRKPAPGLLFRAASALAIDLRASWLVGDILDDIEAGNRAGCRTVLLENGGETEWRPGPYREPEARAASFDEVAAHILGTAVPAASATLTVTAPA